MDGVMELLANPLVWKVLIFYWVFSAFVGALPLASDPRMAKVLVNRPGWELAYCVFLAFLQGLSGNLTRAAIAFKVPGANGAPK